jgi:DNA mismatch endonuclease Vsr
MDRLSIEQRKRNMQSIRSSGSKIEVLLARALWQKGYRYRKNDKTVYGRPDITFKKYKIAIFADSEFWHGKDWHKAKRDIKSNTAFWHEKIERNIQRDKEVNSELTSNSWKVLRFWGKDIQKNLQYCISKIENEINEAKRKNIN